MNRIGRHRARKNGCKHGHHRLGEAVPVGGGIMRRTCELCGAVNLDLTEAVTPGSPRLFAGRKENLSAKALTEARLSR